jgi:hypothetical protein
MLPSQLSYLGCLQKKYSSTFTFYVFSTKKTINHSFNETSTKCENLQKFHQPQISTNYWGYTFGNKNK